MPAKKKIQQYEVTVSCMGRYHSAKGKTILEALQKLDIGNLKGKAVVTVKKGKIEKERVLMPAVVNRLFKTSGLTQEVAQKQFTSLFEGI